MIEIDHPREKLSQRDNRDLDDGLMQEHLGCKRNLASPKNISLSVA